MKFPPHHRRASTTPVVRWNTRFHLAARAKEGHSPSPWSDDGPTYSPLIDCLSPSDPGRFFSRRQSLHRPLPCLTQSYGPREHEQSRFPQTPSGSAGTDDFAAMTRTHATEHRPRLDDSTPATERASDDTLARATDRGHDAPDEVSLGQRGRRRREPYHLSIGRAYSNTTYLWHYPYLSRIGSTLVDCVVEFPDYDILVSSWRLRTLCRGTITCFSPMFVAPSYIIPSIATKREPRSTLTAEIPSHPHALVSHGGRFHTIGVVFVKHV